MNQGWALFLGAFFAFLFTGLAGIASKIHARQVKHFNALVELEYICNENMDKVYSNMRIIDDFEEIVGKKLKENEPAVYGDKLVQLRFNDELILRLGRSNIINKTFSHKIGICRLNHDMKNLNDSYEIFKTAFMQKIIDFETYKFNTEYTIRTAIELKSHLEKFDKEIIDVAANSRVFAKKDKPWLTYIVGKISRARYDDDKYLNDVQAEKKKIAEERKKIQEESGKQQIAE